MKRADVLILSYNAYGRDFEAFMLLKYHLEHAFRQTVHLDSARDLYWIDRLRPKVLVVTDTVNPRNIAAARYARLCGVSVVTIQGEGIFEAGLGEEFIWGWNESREVLEDLRLEWSERNRQLIASFAPELASLVKVTGGGRFDRYRIYGFKDQSQLVSQHGKRCYSRVIGYAGWGFSNLSDPTRRLRRKFLEHNTPEQLEQLLQDREIIVRWLNRVIRAFPDVLFILKHHPGDDGSYSEISLEAPYENALQIRNEEKIEDIIHACDLWIYYNSTTALEAWLLGRPTCAFVPSDTSFLRKGFEQGGIRIHTDQDLDGVMQHFVATAKLPGFDELAEARRHLIEEYVGWGDGFNSLRAAKAVMQLATQATVSAGRRFRIRARLSHLTRHLGRAILTRNGRIGYGGDGLIRGAVRMLRAPSTSQEYRHDGFIRGVIAEAETTRYPQIRSFVAAHQVEHDRVLATTSGVPQWPALDSSLCGR